MSDLGNLLVDSTLVGAGATALGKAHEIAMYTKDAHGTMWKWDGKIAKDVLRDNVKGTVQIAIVTAVVFAAASWVSRVAAKEPRSQQINISR